MSSFAPRHLVQTGLMAGLLLSATVVHAHYPWVMSSQFTPQAGNKVTAFVSWGHGFPIENFMPAERHGDIKLIGPRGELPLEASPEFGYQSPELKDKGSYVLLASQKGGYFTRTTKGNVRQSKEGLDGVLSCTYSSNNMLAVLTVGDGDKGAAGKRYGQTLEIVPLSNPADLSVGDFMDVQIFIHDEPYRGMVFATYGGFSNEGAYAYTVEANNEGKASIRLLHPGKWLVRANVRQPYPDSKVCDIESYTTTLTFQVR